MLLDRGQDEVMHPLVTIEGRSSRARETDLEPGYVLLIRELVDEPLGLEPLEQLGDRALGDVLQPG